MGHEQRGGGGKGSWPSRFATPLRGLRPAGRARSPPGSPQTLGGVLCVCVCVKEKLWISGGVILLRFIRMSRRHPALNLA